MGMAKVVQEQVKTLRVSSVNDYHSGQGKTADLQQGQPGKPLRQAQDKP